MPKSDGSEALLLDKTDHELRLICGQATHQHFKGGLYRLHGEVKDSWTGHPLVIRGQVQILYEHLYPHPRKFWVRDETDFFGNVSIDRLPARWPMDHLLGLFGPRFRVLSL